ESCAHAIKTGIAHQHVIMLYGGNKGYTNLQAIKFNAQL
ncbi:MAG: hypothetical protein ACI9J5_002946, partial [Paraglaciecola sp.]